MKRSYRDSRRRHYVARFYRHNGNTDSSGHPTYTVETDWVALTGQFPCEVLDTVGNETIRGRQVTDRTTHVLIGEYYSGDQAEPTDRVKLSDGRQFSVVSNLDSDGTRTQRRIEARLEQ